MSHACGNISVMPECSNQRTSERAQLLAAMTHPRVKSPLCLKVLYAQKLSEGTTEEPSMQSVTAGKQSETSLSQGWVIRQTKKAARFNENQRSYLDEKFLIGQSTGIKADPSQFARDLRNARTERGKRRFSIDEFLTPQQIKSYFSRKTAKTKQVVADEEAK